eukprot:NODE_1135_length_1560_cov_25.617472_g938_i0.p1 GENE.NODE_1135_length_1560_cov_25.617472_g938_i0~~NODE_1135_length_1560_cov_25.617472_g938_i0.p1  ORF type:complete len:454 (-),score=79.19 NODE_1135_length_1560_cov_25.617472_g938_i0:197-1474(-)
MRAWAVSSHGDALEPQQYTTEIPMKDGLQPGFVRIKVACAGVQPHDVRRTVHLHGSRYPAIPGTDGCGWVDAVGEGVTDLPAGAMVMFRTLSSHSFGAFGEYAICDYRFVVPAIPGLSTANCASLPTPWWSARTILKYQIPTGDRPGKILILGAGSENGLEMYLSILLKALSHPWEVYAACDSRKVEDCKKLGLDHCFAVDGKESTVFKQMETFTEGWQPDKLMDVVLCVKPGMVGLGEAGGTYPSGDVVARCLRFGGLVIALDSGSSGADAGDASGDMCRYTLGIDLLSPGIVSKSIQVRTFCLDSWMRGYPNQIAEIARMPYPSATLHTDVCTFQKLPDGLKAMAAHQVRSKLSVLVSRDPPPHVVRQQEGDQSKEVQEGQTVTEAPAATTSTPAPAPEGASTAPAPPAVATPASPAPTAPSS